MHSPDTIERDRHFAKVKQQLHEQFRDIDKNNDGLLTKAELLDYLLKLTKNQNIAGGEQSQDDIELRERFDEVVTELFDRMDANEDQTVNKTEFVEQYYNEYTQLQEEIEELGLRIKDQKQRSE